MTSALALARHQLVNERRDGPRWAEAVKGAREMRDAAYVESLAFIPVRGGLAYPRERKFGVPWEWGCWS